MSQHIPAHIKLARIFKESKLHQGLDTSVLQLRQEVDYDKIKEFEMEKLRILEMLEDPSSVKDRSRLVYQIHLEDKHLKNKQRAEQKLIQKKKKTMKVIKKKGKYFIRNQVLTIFRPEIFIQS